MTAAVHQLAQACQRFGRDTRGVVAVEMALWSIAIVVPLLSVTDLALYIYRRMQVEIGAQAAAQAAWNTCSTAAKLPAAQNCGGTTLTTAMRTAAQGTSLGTAVTVPTAVASLSDGYYCNNGTTLTLSGSEVAIGGSLPTTVPTCTGGAKAGEYIKVTAAYTFSPLFTGVSIASLLPTNVTKTSWIRLR